MSTRQEEIEKVIEAVAAGERNVEFRPLPGRPGIEVGALGGKVILRSVQVQDIIEQADRGGVGREPTQ
jgi:hypothetical protein